MLLGRACYAGYRNDAPVDRAVTGVHTIGDGQGSKGHSAQFPGSRSSLLPLKFSHVSAICTIGEGFRSRPITDPDLSRGVAFEQERVCLVRGTNITGLSSSFPFPLFLTL